MLERIKKFLKIDRGLNSSKEISSGGSEILRHQRSFGRQNIESQSEKAHANLILRDDYYHNYFGESEGVYHEIIPLDPHIDVFMFPPTDKRPFRTLISSGMSDKAMNVPAKVSQELRYAEILFLIKEEIYQQAPKLFANLVRNYAGFPHEFDTFLAHGHTVPSYNDKPFFPDVNVNHNHILFVDAHILSAAKYIDNDFLNGLEVDGHRVYFITPVLIDQKEKDYKLQKGTSDLLDKIADNMQLIYKGEDRNII